MIILLDNVSLMEGDKAAKIGAPHYGWILIQRRTGLPTRYWSGHSFDHELGSPHEAENPRVYKALSRARRHCRELNGLDDNQKLARGIELTCPIEVAFWIPDEAGYSLDNFYTRMTGKRYPGSVTE